MPEIAGEMRHRLVVEQAAETRNSIGEVTLTFPGNVVGTLWAAELAVSGTEQIAAAQRIGTRVRRFRSYFRANVRTKMRVRHTVEGTVYDIDAIEPGPTRQLMDLICVERGV